MSTFAIVNDNQVIPAVNYLLSNLDTTGNANVTIPGNVLVANTTTGVVSQYGNTSVFGYLYQYVNLRYSNNATGTDGFDTDSSNYSFFGVYNSVTPTPSNNPAAYQWYQVSPPFNSATSRTLYYSAIGGRQIQWAAASAPPNTGWQVTVANVAIDLDVVTTAEGTPGARGPIAAAYVVTTADPNTATSNQLTIWFEAPRDAVSAPIGTGLTPVVGDTATFTYVAGATKPTATFSYNGSIWIPAVGQVVSGNVIVQGTLAGNAIIANTITATQIATGTITANQIAVNTITGNRIAVNTITSNNIAAGTITANNIQTGTLTTNLFTANTINANIIQANTFSANTISGQAIIANTFTANTINGNAITFNTLNGNSIVSGSITTDKLAANVLTANTVISTGATIGNFNSPGFWLQGNTGNARFGNTVSIGNFLTVGNNAQIGGNLSIGNNAVIGNNISIGSNITIGDSLIVGNNAQIGGNVAISGLVSGGALNANTVNTTTIVPSAVSGFASQIRAPSTFYSYTGFSPTVQYFLTISLTAAANQTAYIWSGVVPYRVTLTAPGTGNTWFVDYVAFTLQQNGVTLATWVVDQTSLTAQPTWVNPGYAVSMPVGTNTYRIGAQVFLGGGGNQPTVTLYSNFASILGQALKR